MPFFPFLPRSLRLRLDSIFPVAADPSPATTAARRVAFETSLRIVRAAHAAGVPLLAGTDVGVAAVSPGFSLHDELELLVQAGLTPMEALRAATDEPARLLGVADSLGTIRVGAAADLVLLNADPLVEIGNTRLVAAVLLRGRLLRREELDGLLEEVADRERASGPAVSSTVTR